MDKRTRTDYFHIYGATRPAPRREARMARNETDAHRAIGRAALRILEATRFVPNSAAATPLEKHKSNFAFELFLVLMMYLNRDKNDQTQSNAQCRILEHALFFSGCDLSMAPDDCEIPDDDLPF